MGENRQSQHHCRGAECLFQDDKDGHNQVRCYMCCIWHHIECVSVDKKQMYMIWTCLECRKMAPAVKALLKQNTELNSNPLQMIQMLNMITERLENETHQRIKAEAEIAGVKSQLTELS